MARMKMSDILALYSCDSYHYACRDSTVAEVLPSVDISSKYHKDLKARMAELGINAVPILVYGMSEYRPNTKSLGNGHHRVKIAVELEWPEMEITSDGEESGWRDDLCKVII